MPSYSPILDTEIDASSPITESLMTRLRDNPLALIGANYTALTGSGSYSVPSNVSKLSVICIGGGGGGGGGGRSGNTFDYNGGGGGGGGGGGFVKYTSFSTTGGASISYSCGSGGSGGAKSASNGVNGSNGGDGSYTYFGSVDSGTTTSSSAYKLIQTGQNFTSTVGIGDLVLNTTDNTVATVRAIDSDTQLSLSKDIMATSESFVILEGNTYVSGGSGGSGGVGTTAPGAGGAGGNGSGAGGAGGHGNGTLAEDGFFDSAMLPGFGGGYEGNHASGGGGGPVYVEGLFFSESMLSTLGSPGNGGYDGSPDGLNAAGYGCGGGGGMGIQANNAGNGNGGNGSAGIIFVLPIG